MVRGLEQFRQSFAAHAHQYVLTGGTAATPAFEAAGLPFRATKDLDVVLHVEALDAAFGAAFWRFVTPVPIGEAVASLTAILLDDDYYEFVLS